MRSKSEILRIFENRCRPCEHRENRWCTLCGCRIGRKRRPRRNKIAMATEHCEVGRW